jgi:ATP adenylyltransferase
MDVMWAPWRIDYILGGDKPQECVLCTLGEGGVSREGLVLHVEEHAFVMLNRYPYAGGHLMVVPRVHIGELDGLPDEINVATARLLQRTVQIVRQEMRPHGVNIGMNLGRTAGAGIPGHAHWHVLPRWEGDTNFMPMVAGVRVVNESLFATWDRLRPVFERL